MATQRVFFGLRLPPGEGERLLAAVRAAAAGAACPDLRLPRADGLHLTLYFLGDRSAAAVEWLWTAVRARADGLLAPALEVGGFGAFPTLAAARVLWLGVDEQPGAAGRLAALRAAVLEGCEEAGEEVAAERARAFVPHVTVGRPRRRGAALEGLGALAARSRFRAEALELLASVRDEAGGPPRYAPLHALPLVPGDAGG